MSLGSAEFLTRLVWDMGTHGIEAIVLGTAQDGGIPQLGCDCLHCGASWMGGSLRRSAASLGIVDHEAQKIWLIDASPDIDRQMNLLASSYPGYRLTGVLLTHAHIGHYLGLAFLGRESWNTRDLPVLCTQRMADFLRANQPWKQLVELGNVALSIIEPGCPVQLGSATTATAVLVPHRDEMSDTVAWRVTGPTNQLIYCPDIDRWEGEILDAVKRSDVALLDGTFYSVDEMPDRDILKVPHPCISDSMKTFEGWKTEIRFIHLNHTNLLLGDEGLVDRLRQRGFEIARRADRWTL